jgi:hypothetical protein
MLLNSLKKISILEILVLVLLVVILIQRCGGGDKETIVEPKIIRDTTWIIEDSIINTKPQIITTEPYAVPIDRWNTEYLPDTNYDKLISQYESLVRELLAKNISSDSIKIDSIGHVYIIDTVSNNMITGRSTRYNLRYPIITNTVIVPEKKKRQMYLGGGVQGQKNEIINQINAGLLIKTKKDQIIGINAGTTINGNAVYGVQSFWKIRLKK